MLNDVNLLSSVSEETKRSVKFEYDARGKMVFHENHIGQTIENKYDEYGNLAEKNTKEQTIKIEYDLEYKNTEMLFYI